MVHASQERREVKGALSVKMVLKGIAPAPISQLLNGWAQ
jgi:hypothetical protein